MPEKIAQRRFADIADHGSGLRCGLAPVHARFPRGIFLGLRTLLRTMRQPIRI
jgi:hypothetical protein